MHPVVGLDSICLEEKLGELTDNKICAEQGEPSDNKKSMHFVVGMDVATAEEKLGELMDSKGCTWAGEPSDNKNSITLLLDLVYL